MRTRSLLVGVLMLAPSLARADEPKKYDLEELTDLAGGGPGAPMAEDDTHPPPARADEADACLL
jgi:hypothetical protein